MFYKNLASVLPVANKLNKPQPKTSLHLVSDSGQRLRAPKPSPLVELVVITSRRCSSFFAEAAVLVLVFGILDFFILKGRIELPWILGALSISLGLLAASIATDFGAHRWIKAHP